MKQKIAKLNIEKYKSDILINMSYDFAKTFDLNKGDELLKLGEDVANNAILNYLTNIFE